MLPAHRGIKNKVQLILIMLLILIILTSCELTNTSALAVPATAQVESSQIPGKLPGWLTVYFTNPNPPDNLGNSVDQYILPFIDNAKQSIEATSFDLNLPDLVSALGRASQRGVKVRVVYDGTHGNNELENAATGWKSFDAIKTLKSNGVFTVDGGRSSGLMHNKMLIIDGAVLFSGSWNLSYNDTYRNNNNLLKITDPRLVANYRAEFNDLFENRHFGTHNRAEGIIPLLTLDGVRVENYFSPTDKTMHTLIQSILDAQKSVHFMAFTYTDRDLAAAMIERAKAGVDVQGVVENRYAVQGAFVPLYCANLPVKTDGNRYTMHHKVIILDGETVITGSFNFTKSADSVNDENILIIHSPAVAALYEQEYQRVNNIAEKPQAEDIPCEQGG
jgi:phosphatidylserine/phosphatidylglycerophosphate/cardiolipin synthase-like enzyme